MKPLFTSKKYGQNSIKMSRLPKPKSLITVNVVASPTGQLYQKGVKESFLYFRPEIINVLV
jgi:hypothetical protein